MSFKEFCQILNRAGDVVLVDDSRDVTVGVIDFDTGHFGCEHESGDYHKVLKRCRVKCDGENFTLQVRNRDFGECWVLTVAIYTRIKALNLKLLTP